MKKFQDLPLRFKLILIFLTIAGMTLLFSSAVFVYNDIGMFRSIMIRNLGVLAASVGNNSIGSLVFKDSESAEKILSSLKEEKQVLWGAIYDEKGQLLATYGETTEAPGFLENKRKGKKVLRRSSVWFGESRVDIHHDIVFHGEKIGEIYLHSHMTELEERLVQYLFFVAGLFVLTGFITLILASSLEKIISIPILSLAEKARTISEKGDYSVDIHHPAGDELGILYNCFNTMIQRIRKRERDLVQVGEELREADETLKAFSRMLVESQEQERKRIAGELHDGLGQNLIAINNGIKSYMSTLGETNSMEKVQMLAMLTKLSLDEVREIANNLRPHLLDQLGLETALESMIDRTAQLSEVSVQFHFDILGNPVPKEIEIHLYRIVQEGLNNIIKHSGATEAFVNLVRKEEDIILQIEDNGIGFDVDQAPKGDKGGHGLIGMKERIRLLGGDFILKTEPGMGTSVEIIIGKGG